MTERSLREGPDVTRLRSTVRVTSAQGDPVGTGLVCSDGHILTCAHVVAAAIGVPLKEPTRPEARVMVSFYPYTDDPESWALAKIVFWRPLDRPMHGRLVDVAVLEPDRISQGAARCPWFLVDHPSRGERFIAYGFPAGYETGIWVSGVFGGVMAPGRAKLVPTADSGIGIEGGFSGAPVWHDELGVPTGIIATTDEKPGRWMGFMIPLSHILGINPELACSLPPMPVKLGRVHNVPPLPKHFVERPEVLDPIKESLLSQSGKPVGLVGAGAAVGVHGMGGIGKTVLAAALTRDEDVRRTFPDGICWLTLGRENVDLLSRQVQLAEQLGEDRPTLRDVQHGKSHLKEMLRGKACLIVVDDVWELPQATVFNVVGPRSRVLVTTRMANILRALGAESHDVNVLPPGDALHLLAQWANRNVDTLPDIARDVASECGFLPLALAMVGAMVERRPGSWGSALKRLRQADLQKIKEAFPDYRYPTLFAAIQVSIDDLTDRQRSCYESLAVFPEATPIPELTLTTFWRSGECDEDDCRDTLDALADRSLLRRDDRGRYTLHDLQRDYVRKRAGPARELHARLLDAYREACDGEWHRLPPDSYIHEHLAWHMVQAGHPDRLRKLLLDFRWLCAKLEASGSSALIADYDNLPEDAALRLVQGAVRLSAHIVGRDPRQLGPQLIGRLDPDVPGGIAGLLEGARRETERPWLRPLNTNLAAPGGPLLRTFTGHSRQVNAVAVTPDGRLAVSASSDNTLKLWDLESGEELTTLSGHSGWVTSVAVTSDGRRAVSASDDRTLKLWDLESGQELRTLSGHSGWVTSVAVTPDGQRAVSASGGGWSGPDNSLKLWDLESGEELRTLSGHSRAVNAVAVTPDSRRVVSASDDGTLKLWDLESGEELRTLSGHSNWVRSVAVTPDGQWAISASYDGTLKLWDLESGGELRTLSGHMGGVMSVAATSDGGRAVSASDDRTLRLWDLVSGKELRIVSAHSSTMTSVAVTPDGRRALSASYDGTLKLWDLESGGELRTLSGHMGGVLSVAVTPDGRRAVSASTDSTLKLWDLESGEELRTLSGHGGPVWSVAVTPDGRRVVSASVDKTLKLWDLASGEELRTLSGHSCRVSAVAVTPDGRRAVSASEDETLKLWDLESGQELRMLPGSSGGARSVAVTPDGRRAVWVSSDGTVEFWDLESGEEIRTQCGRSDEASDVEVTPDGRWASSVSGGNNVELWDPEGGMELRTLSGHNNEVNVVGVALDGRRAVSASEDHTLKLWDLERGTCETTFTGETSMECCAVAPDGLTIVAGEWSGRMHFLRLEGGADEADG